MARNVVQQLGLNLERLYPEILAKSLGAADSGMRNLGKHHAEQALQTSSNPL